MQKLDPNALSPRAEKVFKCLQERVKGQDRALRYVSQGHDRFYWQIRDKNRPVFIALLLGMSGTGKGEIPKALARYLFGDSDGYLYVNCPKPPQLNQWLLDVAHFRSLERLHKEEVDKFRKYRNELGELNKEIEELTNTIEILKKDGQIAEAENLQKQLEKKQAIAKKKSAELNPKFKKGISEGWIYNMTNPSKNFNSIAVFDHPERGGQEFYDFFTELVDHGQVPLDEGNTVSFRRSFIFLTSNVAGEALDKSITQNKQLGFKSASHQVPDEEIYQTAMSEAKRSFPPNFLGRIDRVIVLRPLSHQTLLEILDLKIGDLNEMLTKKGCPILATLDQSLKEYILKKSLERPELGAHALNNRFDRLIKKRVMNLIASGQVSAGDKIRVALEKVNEKEETIFYKE